MNQPAIGLLLNSHERLLKAKPLRQYQGGEMLTLNKLQLFLIILILIFMALTENLAIRSLHSSYHK